MACLGVWLGASSLTLCSGFLVVEASAADESPKSVTVLDGNTMYRTFYVYRTPAVIKPDGTFTPAFIPQGGDKQSKIGDYQSLMPPENWRSVDFNDFEWPRAKLPAEKHHGHASGRNPGALHNATANSIICARTQFSVDDPAMVSGLKLSLTYVGGVAVFINDKELIRKNLPDGELQPDTLADRYPDDLYLTADGKSVLRIAGMMSDEEKQLFAKRYRRLDVEVPTALLRKGANVLALRLQRAPVNEAATKAPRPVFGGVYMIAGLWPYVGLHSLNLKAAAGSVVHPNVGRPDGVQLWTCGFADTLDLNSYGDSRFEQAPIAINAVRNGTFSGRCVLSSPRTIEGVKVSISSLKTKGGLALPAERVRLRYARLALAADSSRGDTLFDGLDENIPSEVKAAKGKIRLWGNWGDRPWDEHRSGAVLPLWVTVAVPKDAEPGVYEGVLSVQANGLAKGDVPVRLTVNGWTLPDPMAFRVKHLPVFSPYSLSMRYNVPLWSDEHFKLIAASFRLMAEVNARRVDIDLVPVLRAWSSPLEHSMFRLVPGKDAPSTGSGQASYAYDFSIIDKLFDVVEKTMKAPLPLQINCWGYDRASDENKKPIAGWSVDNKYVPLADPKTNKLLWVANPTPGSEENYTFWKPILDELRQRIEKRGWWAATALGHQSYCYEPSPAQVAIAKRIWPDAAWSYSSHAGTLGAKWGGMPVLYSECVWTAGRAEQRGYKRLLNAGRDKSIWNYSFRNGHQDSSPLSTLLGITEQAILQGHDGLGYLCVDFFPVPVPTRRVGNTRILDSKMGNILGSSTVAILAAGPKGPLPTERYELFRYGTYRAEAVLFLQRSLDAKTIGGELTARVNAYLDKRSRAILSSWGLPWEYDAELFALAAEVEKAAGKL